MTKLGQLLVARGWITVQQLTRALKSQNVAGGRLGTCLLEMDALQEDLLLRGLAEHHGVPAVAVEDLRGIPEEVLHLIPEKISRRCRAVPFRLEIGRLDVALLDPRNLSAQDELAFSSGKRVKVYVANEVRIYEALERYYGEEIPSRVSVLLDRLNRARFLWEKPDESAEPEAAAQRPLERLFATPPRIKLPPPLPELQPVPAAAAARAASPLATAPVPVVAPRPMSVALTPAERAELGAPAAADRPSPAPANLDEVEAALAAARDLDEVGEILLAFLARDHRRAALFQVSRGRVSGWKAQGAGVDREAFTAFSIGFDQPSIFLNL